MFDISYFIIEYFKYGFKFILHKIMPNNYAKTSAIKTDLLCFVLEILSYGIIELQRNTSSQL